ncbi:General negative regulator of transcription subunit 4 [Spatholobus suberectus]|nr:General negative regulator of transcription subunit 4 [Spatholobus suberectus]
MSIVLYFNFKHGINIIMNCFKILWKLLNFYCVFVCCWLHCFVLVKKGCDVDSNGRVDHCLSSKHIASEENRSSYKEDGRKRGEDIEGSCIQDNDSGSIINNLVQNIFDHDESGNGFSGRSSSSSMSTCFSGNVSEVEVDDGCLDDWEAVADALYANDNLRSVVPESLPVPEAAKNPRADFSKTEFKSAFPESHLNCRAWKPDDALRPQCLPNLSKQHSSPLNSNWHGNHKTVPCAWQTLMSQLPQCPICYEDLDVTDSSFLPCSCGFHLCLFCHKKILEADGRCPGCRKLYDHVDGNVGFNIGAKAFHITQPCSMSTGC